MWNSVIAGFCYRAQWCVLFTVVYLNNHRSITSFCFCLKTLHPFSISITSVPPPFHLRSTSVPPLLSSASELESHWYHTLGCSDLIQFKPEIQSQDNALNVYLIPTIPLFLLSGMPCWRPAWRRRATALQKPARPAPPSAGSYSRSEMPPIAALRSLLCYYPGLNWFLLCWIPQDGVILGADTRATDDMVVADKNCMKIHYIAPNI